MRKVRRLKKEAQEACKFRSHKMTKFKQTHSGSRYHYALCEKCGQAVLVTEKPLPNETEISGEAVALNCDIKGEAK